MSSSVGRVTITGYRGEAIEARGGDRIEREVRSTVGSGV